MDDISGASTPRIVRGRRIVTPEGVRPGAIHIEHGRITRITGDGDTPPGAVVVDAGDLLIMPGLVDTHVHMNEPGRTEWEGVATATRAAAAGGVTTVLDMPLNSIPATVTRDALAAKTEAAHERSWTDTGFIGGVVPGNTSDLRGLHRAGVLAFKCFLVPSGVPEFEHVSEADLTEAMTELAALDALLMVHAEHPEIISASSRDVAGDARSYATYLASRPPQAEAEAVALVIRLCEATGARAHIVHVSSAASLPLIADARARGVRISAETCPHYLVLDASSIADGATEFKCAPPIRGRDDREALWAALESGGLDMIVSDHSPCLPSMKQRDSGDFFAAWGGIASLQLGLSIVWTAMRERGLPMERLVRWMCEAPANLVGLEGSKGRLTPGCDADLVLFDPDAAWTVDGARLFHRHPVTPYHGMRLVGRVESTYLRGRLAYDRQAGPAALPFGRLLIPAT